MEELLELLEEESDLLLELAPESEEVEEELSDLLELSVLPPSFFSPLELLSRL